MAFNSWEECLRRDLDRYRGVHGEPGTDVTYYNVPPSFVSMNDAQVQTYLRFRDRFYDGDHELTKSDSYNMLLFNDIIRDDRDITRTMELLVAFLGACENAGRGGLYEYGSRVFQFAIYYGLKLPRVEVRHPVFRSVLLSEMLYPVVEPFPDDVVAMLCTMRADSYDDPDPSRRAIDLFNASLRAVDDWFRETTGGGIMGVYGRGTRLCCFETSPEDMGPGGEKVLFGYLDSGIDLQDFLYALYSYCEWSVGPRDEKYSSHLLDDELCAVIESVYNGGDIIPSEYPVKKGTSVDRLPPNWMADSPIMWGCRTSHQISKSFKSDLEHYRHALPAGRCDYVPSRHVTPEFGSMKPKELAYYLYWRQCAREGRYIETDRGYVWVYICELINDVSDPEGTAKQLEGLLRAYGDPQPAKHIYRRYNERRESFVPKSSFIGRAYVDYCMVNKVPIEFPALYPCKNSACWMLQLLSEGHRVDVCADLFMIFVEADSYKKLDRILFERFDEECADVLADLIAGRHRNGSESARGSLNSCMGYVYDDLKYYGYPNGRRAAVEVFVPYYHLMNDFYINDMKALMKAVIREMDHLKSTGGRVFGIDLKTDVRAAVARHAERKAMRFRRTYAENMRLDGSQITKAESDLMHVTSMMAVEDCSDDARDTTVQTEAECRAAGDPWKDFALRLTDEQICYLEEVLACKVRPDTVMEDSINGIAMDAVGDTVMEDGIPVQEYLEELRSVVLDRRSEQLHRDRESSLDLHRGGIVWIIRALMRSDSGRNSTRSATVRGIPGMTCLAGRCARSCPIWTIASCRRICASAAGSMAAPTS